MANPKSFIFKWRTESVDSLLRTVPNDPAVPFILEHLHSDGFILEGGCGTARVVYFLKNLSYKVVGLEYNKEILYHIKHVYSDLQLLCGDVAALPFADSCLSGIISLGVIEHFPEGPENALCEMFRTLRPGGRAIVTVPHYNQIRRVKSALGIYLLKKMLKGNPLLRRILSKSPRSTTLLPHISKDWYVNFWAGDFYEYWLTEKEFHKVVSQVGFLIIKTKPISHLDGLYIELGPLFVTLRDNEFTLKLLGRISVWLLERLKCSYNNMLLCVAMKPR